MTPDDLKAQLNAWGHATINRYSLDGGERGERTVVHVMTKAREMAPGPKQEKDRKLIDRSGISRRVRMAQSVMIAGVRAVPLWACQAVPDHDDSDRPHDNPQIAVDVGISDDLRWVDDAIQRMRRQTPLRALVIEVEYTARAGQQKKAEIVAKRFGGKFSYSMYRRELEKAHEVLLWERRNAAAML